jgi:hypothetical protein
MVRNIACGMMLVLLVSTSLAMARTDEPAAASAKRVATAGPAQTIQTGQTNAAAIPKSPEFKVVFWYQNGLLKHQAYDVRKGQYTKAVDDWVHRVRYDSSGLYVVPGPLAFVRDVFLEDEPGKPAPDRLAAAIERIEERVRARDRKALADRVYTRGYEGPVTGVTFPLERERMLRTLPLSDTLFPPGAGGYSAAPAPAFPFPYPYVRPHP